MKLQRRLLLKKRRKMYSTIRVLAKLKTSGLYLYLKRSYNLMEKELLDLTLKMDLERIIS